MIESSVIPGLLIIHFCVELHGLHPVERWLALELELKEVLAVMLCIVYPSVLFSFLHVGGLIISVTVYLGGGTTKP
jgi:hypothetical protein